MPLRRDEHLGFIYPELARVLLTVAERMNDGLGVKGQISLGLSFHPCHLLCGTSSHIFLGIRFLISKRGTGSSLSACVSTLTSGWVELFYV